MFLFALGSTSSKSSNGTAAYVPEERTQHSEDFETAYRPRLGRNL